MNAGPARVAAHIALMVQGSQQWVPMARPSPHGRVAPRGVRDRPPLPPDEVMPSGDVRPFPLDFATQRTRRSAQVAGSLSAWVTTWVNTESHQFDVPLGGSRRARSASVPNPKPLPVDSRRSPTDLGRADGEAPPPELAGWKDTIYVPPDTTVRLVARFDDHADPTTPYMFHCHVLRHEDQGMMGQFVVVEPGDEPDLSGMGSMPGHDH